MAKSSLNVTSELAIESLNGVYLNNIDTINNSNFWSELYSSFSLFKKDTTVIPKDSYVKLELKDTKRLSVQLINQGTIINSFNLKGKIIGRHFSVKRNLLLIPIPFAFFYSERKLLLGNSKNGNLVLVENNSSLFWVLIISGGEDPSIKNYEFKKLK